MIGLGVGIDYTLFIVTRFASSFTTDWTRAMQPRPQARPPGAR